MILGSLVLAEFRGGIRQENMVVQEKTAEQGGVGNSSG